MLYLVIIIIAYNCYFFSVEKMIFFCFFFSLLFFFSCIKKKEIDGFHLQTNVVKLLQMLKLFYYSLMIVYIKLKYKIFKYKILKINKNNNIRNDNGLKKIIYVFNFNILKGFKLL